MKRSKLLKKILIIVTLASILVSSLFCLPSSAETVSQEIVGVRIFDVPLNNPSTSPSYQFNVNVTVPFISSVSVTDESEIVYHNLTKAGFQPLSGTGTSAFYFGDANYRFVEYYDDFIILRDGGGFDQTIESNHPLYEQLRTVTFNDGVVSYYSNSFSASTYEEYFVNAILTYSRDITPPPPPPPPEPEGLLDKILNVFLDAGNWITSALGTLAGLFWSFELQKLTLLGMLAVIPVGISMMFIFFYMIKGWCQF